LKAEPKNKHFVQQKAQFLVFIQPTTYFGPIVSNNT
jgi:hypothetical protein